MSLREFVLRSAALSQKAALQMPFAAMTPPMKMGYRNARRRFCTPNNLSADDVQSSAARI